MSNPTLSVAICTYGRHEVLVQTLESLLKCTGAESTEILVIDQTPEHPTAVSAYLEQAHGFHYYQVQPPGIARARGFAAEKATGDILIYIDDDVTPDTDFLLAHLSAHVDTSVGVVAGRVTVPGEMPRRGRVGVINFFGKFSANFTSPHPQDVQDAIGCNFSVKRNLLFQTGNPWVEPGYSTPPALREDSDIVTRIRELGYRVRYEPSAHLAHHVHPKGGNRRSSDRRAFYFQLFHDEFLFYGKHLPAWRIGFAVLGMARPFLAAWIWYGKGNPSWLVTCTQGLRAGLRDAAASPARVSNPKRFPVF